MASDRNIRLYVTMNTAGALVGMEELRRKSNDTANTLEKVGSKTKSLGAGMVSLGRSVLNVSVPLTLLGGYAVKSAMSFQTSMTLIQTQAGASAKEVKWLEQNMKGLGRETAQSPEELAKALFFIESSGVRGGKALEFLKAAAKGATIAQIGVSEQANVLSGVLKENFRDIHSAGEAMAVMNGIVGEGKMHLNELNEAMGTGIMSQAQRSGVSFRELGAAIDTFTRHQVPASVAMTRLRLNLTQMAAPKGVAEKTLAKIGIGSNELAEVMKKNGLLGALQDVNKHLNEFGGLSSVLGGRTIAEAFGGAKGSANMGEMILHLKEYEELLKKSSGYSQKKLGEAFGASAETNTVKMQKAIAGLKEAMIHLGEVLTPVVIPALVKLIGVLESAMKWFEHLPKPIKDMGVDLGLAVVAAGPLLIFFGNLFKAMGSVIRAVGKLVPLMKKLLEIQKESIPITEKQAAAQEALDGAEAGGAGGAAAGGTAAATGEGAAAGGGSLLGGIGFGLVAAGAGYFALKHLVHETEKGLKEFPSTIVGSERASSLYKTPAEQAAGEAAENKRDEESYAAGEKYIIHNHIHLDGKEITHSVTKHLRDHPGGREAKWHAEAVQKTVGVLGTARN